MKGTIIYSLGLIQKIKSDRRRYVIETTGIQGTLFEYFQDMDSFTLEEVRQKSLLFVHVFTRELIRESLPGWPVVYTL